jgi:catechol 2,3-dioxygenase-like lactoylglutathione lyase family enzyme
MRTTTILTLLLSTALSAQLPPHNKEGVTMGHLHMLVKDPAVHRKIWIDVLGLKAVKRGALEVLVLPDAVLAFRKGEPAGGTEASIVNHLGFAVPRLAPLKDKLTAAGCKVVREMPETHQMFVMFPDEIKVEFTEVPDLKFPIAHHHVHFYSQNVEEMRAWYVKHFGAIPGKRGRFEKADLPGVDLSWGVSKTPVAPSKGRSVDHIGFEIRGLEAFCKKLEAAGVKFDAPYRDVPAIGLKIAFFTDPWGTYVELTEGLDTL